MDLLKNLDVVDTEIQEAINKELLVNVINWK